MTFPLECIDGLGEAENLYNEAQEYLSHIKKGNTNRGCCLLMFFGTRYDLANKKGFGPRQNLSILDEYAKPIFEELRK